MTPEWRLLPLGHIPQKMSNVPASNRSVAARHKTVLLWDTLGSLPDLSPQALQFPQCCSLTSGVQSTYSQHALFSGCSRLSWAPFQPASLPGESAGSTCSCQPHPALQMASRKL